MGNRHPDWGEVFHLVVADHQQRLRLDVLHDEAKGVLREMFCMMMQEVGLPTMFCMTKQKVGCETDIGRMVFYVIYGVYLVVSDVFCGVYVIHVVVEVKRHNDASVGLCHKCMVVC
jgi:hypothetical protein